MAKERIGILGGTFDPIHQGHIQMALSALDTCHLDRVLVIPTGVSSYKSSIAPAEDRWKMIVMACTQDTRLIPSRLEMDRAGTGYTVDTLLTLRRQYPKAEFYFILGTDGLLKLHKWHRADEVFSLCTFLICPRTVDASLTVFREAKDKLTARGARIMIIRMNPITVSSTGIREGLASGEATPLLFSPVREYCAVRGLYGQKPRLDQAEEWLGRLFHALNPRRFTHSVSVAHTSYRLARIHGINLRQAEEGGLLHDCAKCLPLREMQRIAIQHSLTNDAYILESSALMHSLVGAWVARNDYGMADPEVLDAIAYHNTGHPGMSRLSMCVCLADFIEPTRGSYPLLENVRILSELSLERALLMSLEGTADFVRSRGKYLHPRTQETIVWLKTLPAVRSSARDGK